MLSPRKKALFKCTEFSPEGQSGVVRGAAGIVQDFNYSTIIYRSIKIQSFCSKGAMVKLHRYFLFFGLMVAGMPVHAALLPAAPVEAEPLKEVVEQKVKNLKPATDGLWQKMRCRAEWVRKKIETHPYVTAVLGALTFSGGAYGVLGRHPLRNPNNNPLVAASDKVHDKVQLRSSIVRLEHEVTKNGIKFGRIMPDAGPISESDLREMAGICDDNFRWLLVSGETLQASLSDRSSDAIFSCANGELWLDVARKAHNENTIYGFITYHIDSASREGHIGLLAVDSKFRNQKIGSELLDRAIEFLKAWGCARVCLNSCNSDAIEYLYKNKFKFREEGTCFLGPNWRHLTKQLQ